MKKLSLIAALTLSTMLSACGGGGGGGGHVPVTSLPNTPSVVDNSKITSMVTTSDRNTAKRTELAENAAKEATSSIATYSMRKSAKTKALTGKALRSNIDTMYDDMERFLVKNDFTGADNVQLYQALLLAGFSKDELEEAFKNNKLEEWITSKDRIASVQLKAQRVYDMYGEDKPIAQDNAKIALVDIDAEQDSYISLVLDGNQNIIKLHVDADVEHPDARRDTMNLKEIDDQGRAIFEKRRPTYVWGLNFEQGPRIWLEVWDKFADTTSKEGWENLVNMMVEELYNDYSGKFSQNELEKYEAEIRKLTLADFAKCENSECMNSGKKAFYGGFDDKPVTVAYQSYAKDSGLKYSDFGTVVIDNWEGAQFNKGDAFVFAGGYDAKRIAKNDMQGDITFVGNAVATVLNQDETTGTRVQNSKIYDGKAELNFNNGTETLKTTFDGWYDVNVVSNGNKNYDVTFSGGDKISDDDAKYFKYTTQNDDFTVKDFVQNPQTDYPYGAVDINYYGDNNIPSEASGYIAYGEKLQQGSGNSGIDLHAQIGFGAVKK